jgi:hypothetical protein
MALLVLSDGERGDISDLSRYGDGILPRRRHGLQIKGWWMKVRQMGRPQESDRGARARRWKGIAACAALLSLFAAFAWLAAHQKNATYDEPLHTVAAWTLANRHDFRINPEDPPLWQYWAALPQPPDALRPDYSWSVWDAMLSNFDLRWPWVVRAMYGEPGRQRIVAADAFLMRSRTMMLMIAVALGALIAMWGWQVGGAAAAVAATALMCFDPNFLAHAPLMKNDVSITLAMSAMTWAAWRCGLRLTWGRAAAVVVLTAIGPVTKFSGVAFPGILAALLGARAMMSAPWGMFGRQPLNGRWRKLGVAAALCAASALLAYGLIWGCYRFRFLASSDPSKREDLAELVADTRQYEVFAKRPDRRPTPEDVAAWTPSTRIRLIVWATEHRLLPEAWLYGLLHTYRGSMARNSYLLGQRSLSGFPMYFPLAFAFKTPLTTLVVLGGAAGLGIGAFVAGKQRSKAQARGDRWLAWWSGACLAIPVLIYGTSAMRSNLNLGIRHLLPIYPYLYVAAGLAAAHAVRRWGRNAVLGLAALGLALAAETLPAFPNFIPFFNVAAARTSRDKLKLLSDSNLDWGQDLKLLVRWQQANPSIPLYLAYFGRADPRYYGLRFTNVPFGGFAGYRVSEGPNPKILPPAGTMPDGPGVLAISATHLQGTYDIASVEDPYAAMRKQEPIDVLGGGTIYLYLVNLDLMPRNSGPARNEPEPGSALPGSGGKPK